MHFEKPNFESQFIFQSPKPAHAIISFFSVECLEYIEFLLKTSERRGSLFKCFLGKNVMQSFEIQWLEISNLDSIFHEINTFFCNFVPLIFRKIHIKIT